MAVAAAASTALGCARKAFLSCFNGEQPGHAPAWNLDKYLRGPARRAGSATLRCIRRELGYAPAVNLEQGMAEAVQGYRREGWL